MQSLTFTNIEPNLIDKVIEAVKSISAKIEVVTQDDADEDYYLSEEDQEKLRAAYERSKKGIGGISMQEAARQSLAHLREIGATDEMIKKSEEKLKKAGIEI